MQTILERIHSDNDIKKLTVDELIQLSDEIREFLVQAVSKTGGHLSSNLGVVELTVALHRVFDLPKDQIVWDVGHQCYTHKILTERKEKFEKLRQENGLSGFPKREESEYDCFNTGHSSTSVAAAFGLCRAKELQNQSGHVIAVIGDGALTGGLAYEGLNNVGRFHKNFIVILNDNRLSISRNVGAMARHLAILRTKPAYKRVKNKMESILTCIPFIGNPIFHLLSKLKTMLKNAIYPSTIFEELGFRYIGPIDGHDYPKLIAALQQAKEEDSPCFVHICTVKGKGYSFAEEDPSDFHGISKFDPDTGEKLSNEKSFSDVFGEELYKLAEKDNSICAITAAMKLATGLDDFSKAFKERFFDVGIAEDYAVTFAAGLAVNGMTPVFAVFSTFLQRAYDQIIHDVALQHLHTVLAIDRAGLVGNDGETHQGVFDVAFINPIPDAVIYAPTYFSELAPDLYRAIYEEKGLAAIRYPRGGQPAEPENFVADGKDFRCFGAAHKILLVTYGRLFGEAVVAQKYLAEYGIQIDLLKINKIKPLAEQCILIGMDYQKVYFAEEGILQGGIAQSYLLALNRRGFQGKIYLRGIEERFIPQASVNRQLQMCGLDAASLRNWIRQAEGCEG